MTGPTRRSIGRPMLLAAIATCFLTAPLAAADPYTPAQTQDSAEFTIADGYIAKQIDCTPDMPPTFESITWNPPGFTPAGGSAMINDANPALGGPFVATWAGNHWAVEYQYC